MLMPSAIISHHLNQFQKQVCLYFYIKTASVHIRENCDVITYQLVPLHSVERNMDKFTLGLDFHGRLKVEGLFTLLL